MRHKQQSKQTPSRACMFVGIKVMISPIIFWFALCYLVSVQSRSCGSSLSAGLFALPHSDDTALKTVRLTIKLQHRKREVKTGKITARLALRKCVERKCQHVIVVKCCLKSRSQLLRMVRVFFFLHLFGTFVQSLCSIFAAYYASCRKCDHLCAFSLLSLNSERN